MELWLVRHGESVWNHARRFQGAQDAELSPRGHEQARAVGEALVGQGVEALYTSPLRRTRDTAAPAAFRLGVAAWPVDGLREVALGDWEGLTVDTVIERYGDLYWKWLSAPGDHPPPGGESMADLQRRVTAALEAIRDRHRHGRVVAVTHGGAIASFICGCLELGLNAMWRIRVDNGSITRVELPLGRLLSLNDTRHLEAEAASARGPEASRPATKTSTRPPPLTESAHRSPRAEAAG